jgi:hypothetical protein
LLWSSGFKGINPIVKLVMSQLTIQKAGSASDVTSKNTNRVVYGNILGQELAAQAGIIGRVTRQGGGGGASSSRNVSAIGGSIFTYAEKTSVVTTIIANTATNARTAAALTAAANSIGVIVVSPFVSAAAVAWSPINITGITIWLDGADPAGTGSKPANGATVSTWVDKSGNSYSTTSVVGTPTYSLTSGILFNGSSYFNLPNGSIPFNNTSYTIYFVLNFTDFNGSPGWFGAGAGGSNQTVSIRHESSSIRIYWYNNDLSTTSTSLAGVPFIFSTQYQTGGQRTAFINGTAAGSDTPGTRTQPNTGNTIGRAIDSAYINGSIREVIVYNTNHNLVQRQQVEGYLALKWGLSSNLPVTHPSYLPPTPVVLLRAINYSGSGAWNDESGNGKNATLENGTAAKNAAGNGIVLNGSTNWTFPNIGLGNSWTLCAWYKNTGTPIGNASIITQIYGAPTNYLIQMGNADFGSTNSMCGAFINASWYRGTTFTFTDGVWTNVQITWNGTTMSTYIDGSLIGSAIPGGSSLDAGSAWRIGRRWDSGNYMVGEIGEVRIYSKALVHSEITAIYNSTYATYMTSAPINPVNIPSIIFWGDMSHLNATTTTNITNKVTTTPVVTLTGSGGITQLGLNNKPVLTVTTAQSFAGSTLNIPNWTLFTLARKTSLNGRLFTDGGNYIYGYWGNARVSFNLQEEGAFNYPSTVPPSIVNSGPEWDIQTITKSNDANGLNFKFNWNGVTIKEGTSLNYVAKNTLLTNIGINTAEASSAEIAEILIFNSRLSDLDIQKVEGYLAWKWGLQTSDTSDYSPIIRCLLETNILNTGTSSATRVATNTGSVTIGTNIGKLSATFASGKFITVPFTGITQGPFSVSYWFNPIDGGDYDPWTLSFNNDWQINPDILNGTQSFFMRLPGIHYGGGFTYTPASGGWNHVTLTVSATSTVTGVVKAYLNGVLKTTVVATGPGTLSNAQFLYIGKSDSRIYNGYLRRFRVHDFVLTQEQITSIYKQDANVLSASHPYAAIAPTA